MTKQEAIEKAYGQYYEAVKDKITEFGFLPMDIWHEIIGYNGIDEIQMDSENRIRPFALKGIEDNNGWILLEGKPNEIEYDGDVWIINKNGDIEINLNHEYLELGYATHYQPINKPLKPIY